MQCVAAVSTAVKSPAAAGAARTLMIPLPPPMSSSVAHTESALPAPSGRSPAEPFGAIILPRASSTGENSSESETASPSGSEALTTTAPVRPSPIRMSCTSPRTGGESERNTMLSTAAVWLAEGEAATSLRCARSPSTRTAPTTASRHPAAEPLNEAAVAQARPSAECCTSSADSGPPARERSSVVQTYSDAFTAAMAVASQPRSAPHPDEASAAEPFGPTAGAARQLPPPDIIQEPPPDSNPSANPAAPLPFAADASSSDRTVSRPLRTIMLASGGPCPPVLHSAAKSLNEAAVYASPGPLAPYSAAHIPAVALDTVSPPSSPPAVSWMSHRAEATRPAEPSAKLEPDDEPRSLHFADSRSRGYRWSWYRTSDASRASDGKKYAQPSAQAHASDAARMMPAVQWPPPG